MTKAPVGIAQRASVGTTQQSLELRTPRRVHIDAGYFLQGTSADGLVDTLRLCRRNMEIPEACRPELFEDELPQRRVYLSRYAIDRWEVSHGDYQRCVDHGECAPVQAVLGNGRAAPSQHPVVGVTWRDAQRYCRFAGGRLPTEAEWERAARGSDDRLFPWGRLFNDRLANHGRRIGEVDTSDGFRYAAPVRSFFEGRSPYALWNMAGNVWELTADYYAEEAYSDPQRVDPQGPAQGSARVMRGGSWRSPPYQLRVTYRGQSGENDPRPDVGFRCAYSEH